MKLDMNKSAGALRLALAKHGITAAPNADLAFDLDVSGSFDDEHRGGLTQSLLSRLVPWSMVFDPDNKIDVFTFSDGLNHAHHVGDVTPDTTDGFIQDRIIGKVPGYNGSTDYSYVLEANLRHFGWIPGSVVPAKKAGILGGLFRRTEPTAIGQPAPERKKSIIIFVTDGENADKDRTEHVLADSENRQDEVYFLFIGVSNQRGAFPFLKKIGDQFTNTGLVIIDDLPGFVKKTDEEINDILIGDELIKWLKK
jgi:hypothetical protein